MPKLYKAVIQSTSSFTSPLQSDTFFGAFCWKYRHLFGNDSLEQLLQEMTDENPVLVFSNAFPTNTVCRPLGIIPASSPVNNASKQQARDAYAQKKKEKRMDLMSLDGFTALQKGNTDRFYSSLDQRPEKLRSLTRTRVERKTAGITPDNEGTLFCSEEYWAQPSQKYDLYVLSTLDEAVLEEVIRQMLITGIGGSKSIGKGSFQLLAFEEESSITSVQNPNAVMVISNFIPSQSDPVRGNYKVFLKNGKLDRESVNTQSPFKKPMLYIQEGAVFQVDEYKPWLGSITRNISTDSKVIVNSMGIALPMHIPDPEQTFAS